MLRIGQLTGFAHSQLTSSLRAGLGCARGAALRAPCGEEDEGYTTGSRWGIKQRLEIIEFWSSWEFSLKSSGHDVLKKLYFLRDIPGRQKKKQFYFLRKSCCLTVSYSLRGLPWKILGTAPYIYIFIYHPHPHISLTCTWMYMICIHKILKIFRTFHAWLQLGYPIL